MAARVLELIAGPEMGCQQGFLLGFVGQTDQQLKFPQVKQVTVCLCDKLSDRALVSLGVSTS